MLRQRRKHEFRRPAGTHAETYCLRSGNDLLRSSSESIETLVTCCHVPCNREGRDEHAWIYLLLLQEQIKDSDVRSSRIRSRIDLRRSSNTRDLVGGLWDGVDVVKRVRIASSMVS